MSEAKDRDDAMSEATLSDLERQLDLLVDGELSEPRRQELLSSLDHWPDGWRRCALAFLEEQAWRTSLRSNGKLRSNGNSTLPWSTDGADARPAVEAAAVESATPSVAPLADQGVRQPTWPTLLLGIAASFLAAFAVTWGWQWGSNEWGTSGGTGGDWGSRGGPLASPGVGASASSVAQQPIERSPTTGQPLVEATPVVSTLKVRPVGTGPDQEWEVPLVEVDRFDPAWLRQPSAVPPDVVRDLRRAGHRVQQRRQVWPIPLQDGRQVVLPVDEIDVQYVGHPFQ